MIPLRQYPGRTATDGPPEQKTSPYAGSQDVRGQTAHAPFGHLGKGSFRPRCIPRPGLSARGPDRGDFIPRTHDQGGLRARPGPPDRGRFRSPSGLPSSGRIGGPWVRSAPYPPDQPSADWMRMGGLLRGKSA